MNEKFLFLTRSWREPCPERNGKKKESGQEYVENIRTVQ